MKSADRIILLLLCAASGQVAATTCSVTANPLAFGNYASPGGAQTDSSGTLAVTCHSTNLLLCNVNYSVSLSTGGAGSYSPRQLASGANRLNYNLYTSAARTTVWGDGSGGSASVNGTIVTGLLSLILCGTDTNNHTIYGRIPAAQNKPAGSYADTITVTVTY